MSRLSKLLATIGAGALLVTAVAAPVAAVEPVPEPSAHVTVVQGIPGEVDICVGGVEVASNVKFGKWASRTVTKFRTYKLRVYRPDERQCGGKLILMRKVELEPGSMVTMELKLGRPRVVTFDLMKVGAPSAADVVPFSDWVPVIVGHAARARNVEMRLGIGMAMPPGAFLAEDVAEDLWNAGDVSFLGMPTDFEFVVGARRDGKRIVRPKPVRLIKNKLHQVFLVGWNKDTYRWVVVRTPLEDLGVR